MWQRQNSKRKRELTESELLNKAAAYCSVAEHCPVDVKEKLRTWGAAPELLEPIVDRLIDENFISEERYCRAFVNDKIRFQSWGKEKIRLALTQKRLPSCCIDEALESFPDEDYMLILSALVAKKASQLQHEDDNTYRAKMLRYLLGRGFSFGDIRRALDSLDD